MTHQLPRKPPRKGKVSAMPRQVFVACINYTYVVYPSITRSVMFNMRRPKVVPFLNEHPMNYKKISRSYVGAVGGWLIISQ